MIITVCVCSTAIYYWNRQRLCPTGTDKYEESSTLWETHKVCIGLWEVIKSRKLG